MLLNGAAQIEKNCIAVPSPLFRKCLIQILARTLPILRFFEVFLCPFRQVLGVNID
jgi:hypothetical protein